MPKCLARQVTVSPNSSSPLVRPAMACSPVCLVDSMCRSMLGERSKTFSIGALMIVFKTIFAILILLKTFNYLVILNGVKNLSIDICATYIGQILHSVQNDKKKKSVQSPTKTPRSLGTLGKGSHP